MHILEIFFNSIMGGLSLCLPKLELEEGGHRKIVQKGDWEDGKP